MSTYVDYIFTQHKVRNVISVTWPCGCFYFIAAFNFDFNVVFKVFIKWFPGPKGSFYLRVTGVRQFSYRTVWFRAFLTTNRHLDIWFCRHLAIAVYVREVNTVNWYHTDGEAAPLLRPNWSTVWLQSDYSSTNCRPVIAVSVTVQTHCVQKRTKNSKLIKYWRWSRTVTSAEYIRRKFLCSCCAIYHYFSVLIGVAAPLPRLRPLDYSLITV